MKEKIRKYWWVIIIVLILGGAFYWFQWRPAIIKHNCSWVKMVNPATSAQPAITREEAEYSQLKYDECVENMDFSNSQFPAMDKLLSCGRNFEVKKERDAIPAKPEAEWYRNAKKDEYDFCIHDSGL